MTDQQTDPIFSPIPPPFDFPFYYGLLSLFWIFYRVDSRTLEPFLEGTGLKPARFEGQGLVSLDFQNYSAHISTGLSVVNEVEFNIFSYPTSRESIVPTISLEDFVMGQEQTKTVGGFRLHVPCDNDFAIKAGIEAFGERKFPAAFNYAVPSFNNPKQGTWNYTCCEPDGQSKIIYSVEADIRSLRPAVGNASSLILYSMLPGGPDHPPGYGRLIESRWDIFGTYQTYCNLDEEAQGKIKLSLGDSEYAMRKDMDKIIGSEPAAAVRVFQSPPFAAENRAFYVDEDT